MQRKLAFVPDGLGFKVMNPRGVPSLIEVN
jgi:hypothetical protein